VDLTGTSLFEDKGALFESGVGGGDVIYEPDDLIV
jgi:hypothetical protein